MNKSRGVFFVTVLMVLFGLPGIFPQENGAGEPGAGTIPGVLLRPERGEALRYPEDTVIGAMDRGSAPESAWLFAGDLLSALVAGNKSALTGVDTLTLDNLLGSLGEIEAQSWRLGSGREEADGSVSFLVRFIGRDQWVTGELYLRPREKSAARAGATRAEAAGAGAEADAPEAGAPETAAESGGENAAAGDMGGAWLFDDLSLEEKRDRGTEGDNRRFDFSPYERFF
jgi:hypothetical protein